MSATATSNTAYNWLWLKSVAVGLACFAVVFLWWNILQQISPHGSREVADLSQSWSNNSIWDLVRLFAENAVLVTIVEALIFFLPAALLLRLAKFPLASVLYVILVALVGWVVHGMGLPNIGRSAAFGILASWFWYVMSSDGLWRAFISNVIAHGTWNAVLIFGWALRS